MTHGTPPLQLVVVSAGASDPSSTRMLADRTAARTRELAAGRGHEVAVTAIELRDLAPEITTAMTSQFIGEGLRHAIETLASADGVIAATPVYKAGASGLFTSFFQVLDNDLLIAAPVILAATAGTARHALVVDAQIRPVFAYLRTMVMPTSLFAATEDWKDPALPARIDRAATELVLQMASGVGRQVREESWSGYQHSFGSTAEQRTGIDLDSDLMRLAAGGR